MKLNTVSLSKDSIPIAEFKAHADQWLKRLHESHTPVVLTQDGKPAAVLISPEDFDCFSEKQRFIESTLRGLIDAETGRVYKTEALMSLIDEK